MASSLPWDGKPGDPVGEHFVGHVGDEEEISFSEFRLVVKHENGEHTLSELHRCEIDFKSFWLLFEYSDDDDEAVFAIS